MKLRFWTAERRTPLVVGAFLLLISAGLTGSSRFLDHRARHAQAILTDLRAALNDPDAPDVKAAGDDAIAADNLQKLDLLQRLEWSAFDWRVRMAATRVEPVDDLGLVLADNNTVTKLSQGGTIPGELYDLLWPRWPVYGRVLRELRQQGAAAVAFDVMMPDRRHSDDFLPANDRIAEELNLGNRTDFSSDMMFARELANRDTAAILALEPDAIPTPSFHRNAAALGDASSPRDADSVARRVRAFTRFDWHNPEIAIYAETWTNRTFSIDADGTIECVYTDTGRTNHYYPTNGIVALPKSPRLPESITRSFQVMITNQLVWHLGIVLAAQKLGLDLERPEIRPDGIVLRDPDGHLHRIPTDSEGYFYVDWGLSINRTDAFSQENMTGVIEDGMRRLDTNSAQPVPRWKGKLVVVGSTGSGSNISDRGATPLDKSDFLVTTYLNVANSLLRDRFIRRPGLAFDLACVLSLATLAAALTWRVRNLWAPLIMLGLAAAWLALAVWAFLNHRFWIPVAHPLLAGIALNYGGMVTYRALFEQKEQQRIRSVFARMVSPNIVHEMLAAQHIRLQGERAHVTVFFADVRGFTAMTDKYQVEAEEHVRTHNLDAEAAEQHFEIKAAEVLDTVNQYLAAIADVVKFHNGTLDKFIGDCVMAYWGAPTKNPRHAVDCVIASIDAQRAILRLNEERAATNASRVAENAERATRGEPPLPELTLLALGTGVNTGNVTVGLMGSEAHIVNYTVFGREVNLASRLEGVSGHARIVIGEATYMELRKHARELADLCVALEPVPVKGFRLPVTVYEVPWKAAAETAGRISQLLNRVTDTPPAPAATPAAPAAKP